MRNLAAPGSFSVLDASTVTTRPLPLIAEHLVDGDCQVEDKNQVDDNGFDKKQADMAIGANLALAAVAARDVFGEKK